MKPNLTSLLHRTVEDGGTICAGDTNLEPWSAWEKEGILVPAHQAEWLICGRCNASAEVVWLTDREGKKHGLLRCSCGPQSVDPLQVRSWKVRIETILEKLIAAWDIPGEILPIIPNLLWKLGTKAGWTLFYLRRYWDEEERGVLAELARFKNPVVICGNNFVCRALVHDYAGQCITLENIANLDEQGNLILEKPSFMDYFGGLQEPEEKPKQSVAPKAKRGGRAANIEKLVKEMEQHLRSARSHALATAAGGNIELLSRPTQEELAKLTGMRKMEVTRCLKDPEAKYLKMLWDRALDLNSIAR